MNRCRLGKLLPLLALALASCRGGPPVDVVGSAGTPDDWFCDPAPDGGWACVRGTSSAAAGTTTRRLSEAPPAKEPAQDAGGRRAQTAEQSSDSAGSLIDAPASHYAVQLIALGSEQALRDFVAERQLADMALVRVENGGRLHFVLVAGVHPTRAAAELAVAAMAPALRALGPWIRSVDDLRQAMARADRQAEATP